MKFAAVFQLNDCELQFFKSNKFKLIIVNKYKYVGFDWKGNFIGGISYNIMNIINIMNIMNRGIDYYCEIFFENASTIHTVKSFSHTYSERFDANSQINIYRSSVNQKVWKHFVRSINETVHFHQYRNDAAFYHNINDIFALPMCRNTRENNRLGKFKAC